MDVDVEVGVAVIVAVAVAVLVGAAVCVAVGVEVNKEEVEVGDRVNVGVSVIAGGGGFVFVDFRFGVEDGMEGMNTNVLVGLLVITAVEVAEETVVGAGKAVEVMCSVGNGVPVTIETPGVRKSIQPGGVRIEASTGSKNPLGRRVR